MPPFARLVLASVRGHYLCSWRYGRDTERVVQEALDRERLTADEWRQWQVRRLAKILQSAATHVPHRLLGCAGATRERRSNGGLEQLLGTQLRARLDEVRVLFEPLDHLPRGRDGEFRTVVCNLPQAVLVGLGATHTHASAAVETGSTN